MLADNVPRPLNADCWDIDGDGVPEVILAYRFESDPRKSIGNVVLLKNDDDARQRWTAREIDRVPTAHRVPVPAFYQVPGEIVTHECWWAGSTGIRRI